MLRFSFSLLALVACLFDMYYVSDTVYYITAPANAIYPGPGRAPGKSVCNEIALGAREITP